MTEHYGRLIQSVDPKRNGPAFPVVLGQHRTWLCTGVCAGLPSPSGVLAVLGADLHLCLSSDVLRDLAWEGILSFVSFPKPGELRG